MCPAAHPPSSLLIATLPSPLKLFANLLEMFKEAFPPPGLKTAFSSDKEGATQSALMI